MISVGNQIGRYKVLDLIGIGGMGEVFLAEDLELGRLVAIKVLPSGLANNEDRIRRFVQEAKAVSALNHPNILTIYEIGTAKGVRFIVSEFIKGKTLRQKLKSESLTLSEKIEIAIQIASALLSAHSNQIIHRDIKPDNVMIRDDNLVKVLDFGLAKLTNQKSQVFDSESPTYKPVNTRSGTIIGTVGYMSPEQARGKTVDHRTDIFSLGVVLYEMITGKVPFPGESNSDVIAAILMKEPQNPRALNSAIPVELELITLKMLAKDCGNRYDTAKDLLEALRELRQNLDFKSKGERRIQADEIADADTKTIETDDIQTADVETDSVKNKPTRENSSAKHTNVSNFVHTFRRPVPLILGLTVIGFLVYFISSTVWSAAPKPEAVKLFDNGIEALREGTYYKASKMFEDALGIDKDFAKARAGLAEAWMELDYFGRAQSEMLKVNEIQSKKQTFVSGFYNNDDSLYIDAINATVRRDFPAAIEIYHKIADRDPSEPYVYLDLGRAYEKNEEIDKAIENFEKSVNLNGQYGAGFLRLGIALRRKAQYDKSEEAFARAENIYDRLSNDEGIAEVKYQRGVSLSNQGKLDAARAQFEQVISNPRANKYQQIRAMAQISNTCSGEGKTDCAEEFALKAISLAKNERMENAVTTAFIDLGNAFLSNAEYEKAEQNFQQALEFARKDDGLRNEALALLALASLRIQQKKPDEALDYAGQALSFFQKGNYDKQILQVHLAFGRAFELKEDYNAALEAFQKVADSTVASLDDKALAKMYGGNVLMQQEKYPEAYRRFEESYNLYRSLNDSFYAAYTLFYLSEVLFQLGRFEEAQGRLSDARTIMGEKHGLLPLLTTKTQFLNARIALSRQNFAEAIKEVQPISLSKNASDVFEANIIMGLAQTASKSNGSEGVQNCVKALDYALSTADARTINTAKLALAQAYLNTEKYFEAKETALQAKDYFINAGQSESGWRALFIAAKACRQNGDYENARNFAGNALETLRKLQNDWGQDFYAAYVSKPDINLLYKQTETLAHS